MFPTRASGTARDMVVLPETPSTADVSRSANREEGKKDRKEERKKERKERREGGRGIKRKEKVRGVVTDYRWKSRRGRSE